MLKRAHSLLEIKAVDEDKREITGIATTPTVDRMGDIVEPKGAEFQLPIPFLWQHDASKPIGHVTKAKVTKEGIEVTVKLVTPDAGAPPAWADRLNEAWADIKSGLVRGLSIGFQSVEAARIEGTYGVRFLKWLWLELSGVTIAANGEASIQTIKSIDRQLLAASGREQRGGVALIKSPPASRETTPVRKRGPVQLIPRKYDRGKEDSTGSTEGS